MATIQGQRFATTDNKVYDLGDAFLIVMTSGNQVIAIVTKDKNEGVHPIINIASSVQAGTSWGAYSIGSDLYHGLSGTVSLSLNASGKISGMFTLEVKNAASNTLSISNGRFNDLDVIESQAPKDKCVISAISGVPLVYDSDGKLLKDHEGRIYLWVNGVVASSVDSGSNWLAEYDWFYTTGKLTMITGFSFTYNAAGLLTGMARNHLVYNFTYDSEGNITSAVVYDYRDYKFPQAYFYEYSGYDNRPNPNNSAALGLSIFPTSVIRDSFALSKNNVGLVSGLSSAHYNYTYDANGNVIAIAWSTAISSGTIIYTYAGFN